MTVVGGWYLRLFEGSDQVHLYDEEILIDELERFYDGSHRLIIAFRHVAKEDAPVMMYALDRKLRAAIKERNRRRTNGNRIDSHARFLYGSDVLNWAGKAAAWLFPKIGCVPVQNRGTNKQGLTILRNEVREGRFPIALAPEAQVTYHMYNCSTIAPGISSLAAWGAESAKDVTIIPVAIGYRHSKDPELFIRSVALRWEKLSGIPLTNSNDASILTILDEMTQHTLQVLEEAYPPRQKQEPTEDTRARILALCDRIMVQAETMAQLDHDGSILDRLFRIRYRGVDAIHPCAFDPKLLPPVGRSIADTRALEAHAYLRHSQVVDVLEYIDPAYIGPPCPAGRACEYALNLLDVLNRLQGGNINTRFSPKKKQAMVLFGHPLYISSNSEESRKTRVQRVTGQVGDALQEVSKRMEQVWETQYFQ
jgi:1-acyl-sn-glycerol-3-phosphate acyltransferase